MEPHIIKALRAETGQNAEKFGQRFSKSGRTVENWEQGRNRPDSLAERMLWKLRKRLEYEARKARQIENGVEQIQKG